MCLPLLRPRLCVQPGLREREREREVASVPIFHSVAGGSKTIFKGPTDPLPTQKWRCSCRLDSELTFSTFAFFGGAGGRNYLFSLQKRPSKPIEVFLAKVIETALNCKQGGILSGGKGGRIDSQEAIPTTPFLVRLSLAAPKPNYLLTSAHHLVCPQKSLPRQ